MSETLEQRIYRMSKNNDGTISDAMLNAYASDVAEILNDKDNRIKDSEKVIEEYQKALTSAYNLLEEKYDYEEHCACEYSGSGGTVRQCDFHKLQSLAEHARFEYEKHWKHFHRG